jgi:hypothetical protein
MSDQDLMQSIWNKFHAPLAATGAVSSAKQEFLAALIANESGGDPRAERFEPQTYLALSLVMLGRKAQFAPAGCKYPLTQRDLWPAVAPEDLPGWGSAPPISGNFVARLLRLARLATSIGLTQIMCWHEIELQKPMPGAGDPAGQLRFTALLLTVFANEYGLDLGADFQQLFHCWNTGTADVNDQKHHLFDPNYIKNGLQRMAIYAQIAAAAAPAAGG